MAVVAVAVAADAGHGGGGGRGSDRGDRGAIAVIVGKRALQVAKQLSSESG